MENTKPLENRHDIAIKDNTAIYTVSYQSNLQGTLIGTFHFRPFLLPSQKLEAGRERRRLLGEFGDLASTQEKELAFILSELRQRIILAPSFWKVDELLPGNTVDETLIFQVGDAALESEVIYKKQKEEEKKKLIERAMAESAKILKNRQEAKEKEMKEALEKKSKMTPEELEAAEIEEELKDEKQ